VDLLPELFAGLALSGLVGLDGGKAQLAMSGGEVRGGFPDQVGDVTMGGQVLQRGGVDVGAGREPVIAACQAK
jgi:hypothetical protein